jgi:GDP-4-dehydro-6-deoxy-D-mannose reductase
MKVLVTGGAGFVGRHLIATLHSELGAEVDIRVTSRSGGSVDVGVPIEVLDVTDGAAVSETIRNYGPSHIVHLAALAAVQNARAHVDLAWRVHVFGTLNIANAIMNHAPDCVLLFVGSGQVYGSTARTQKYLDEDALLAPTNDYGVTKAAADLALGCMAAQGLRCLRLRPFNHTGRNQTEDFVIPRFAMQIARIEAGIQPPVIKVGNLNTERDFLDVRDVCRSYALAIARSKDLKSGVIYNIASGVPRRISDILENLRSMSDTCVEIQYDQSRMFPSDTPSLIGDASRARRDLNWEPRIEFDETLKDMLAFARMSVASR